jgi:hypothetical protein
MAVKDWFPVKQKGLSATNALSSFNTDYPALDFDLIKRKTRIAFIDNEIIEVQAHLTRLQRDGYNVFYHDEISSLESIANQGFHVIVLDVDGIGGGLTREGGWGLLKSFKKEWPEIGVIMFTGSEPDFFKVKDIALLADEVLDKTQYVDDHLGFRDKLKSVMVSVMSTDYQTKAFQSKINNLTGDLNAYDRISKIIETQKGRRNPVLEKIDSIGYPKNIVVAADKYLTRINSLIELGSALL